MKDKLMILVLAAAMRIGAHGADVTIGPKLDPETGNPMIDPVSGMQIGDVDALTNALKTCSAGDTISLESGIYDIAFMTNSPMSTSGYGTSLLVLNKKNLTLKGATGDRDDVMIKANGDKYSLINLESAGCVVRDLSLSGGFANTAGADNNKTGGGVHFMVDDAMVSNCVITACRSASANGGGAVSGVYSYKRTSGTCYDCLFHGNNTTRNGSLVGYLTTFRNCVFSNNVTTASVASEYNGSITLACRVYDSLFIGNQANACGGVYGGVAVNCRFLFNTASNPEGSQWNNVGGGGARDATLTNCYFYGNRAYRFGGAIRGGKVVNCTVVSNSTIHATDANGGGIYGATLVENCMVVSNFSGKCGGGLGNCSGVTNVYVAFNAVYGASKPLGGGLYGCGTITNCVVEYNICATVDNGSGMCNTSAYGTQFRFNGYEHASRDGVAYSLVKCEFVGSAVIMPDLMEGCRVHHFSNAVDVVDNVKYGPCSRTALYAVQKAKTVRNCLFDHNYITNVGNTAYLYTNTARPLRVENCTFADNVTQMTMRGYDATDRVAAFVNCVFSNNRRGSTKVDISGYDAAYTVFSNCYAGVCYNFSQNASLTNSNLMVMGASWNPRFVGEGDHPYSLKWRSPLRGEGLLLDWMADGVDFAGNPRLRDGMVDIGCYQCWLDPIGMTLIFR